MSVDARCPGCKRPISDHLPSSREMPKQVEPGMVPVVQGWCFPDGPDGQPAPQKCCWVQYSTPMTVAEYRQALEAKTLVLEPCPCCGGVLAWWGSFPRHLKEDGSPELAGIRLLRGKCENPECPVCTVTHYVVFVTPYATTSTTERETAVRAHVEDGGRSWSAVGRLTVYALDTVRTWFREIVARAAEVTTGVLGIWQDLDHDAPAEVVTAAAVGTEALVRGMFRACDAVAELLRARCSWGGVPVPALAVPRMFRPTGPTTLPVWA